MIGIWKMLNWMVFADTIYSILNLSRFIGSQNWGILMGYLSIAFYSTLTGIFLRLVHRIVKAPVQVAKSWRFTRKAARLLSIFPRAIATARYLSLIGFVYGLIGLATNLMLPSYPAGSRELKGRQFLVSHFVPTRENATSQDEWTMIEEQKSHIPPEKIEEMETLIEVYKDNLELFEQSKLTKEALDAILEIYLPYAPVVPAGTGIVDMDHVVYEVDGEELEAGEGVEEETSCLIEKAKEPKAPELAPQEPVSRKQESQREQTPQVQPAVVTIKVERDNTLIYFSAAVVLALALWYWGNCWEILPMPTKKQLALLGKKKIKIMEEESLIVPPQKMGENEQNSEDNKTTQGVNEKSVVEIDSLKFEFYKPGEIPSIFVGFKRPSIEDDNGPEEELEDDPIESEDEEPSFELINSGLTAPSPSPSPSPTQDLALHLYVQKPFGPTKGTIETKTNVLNVPGPESKILDTPKNSDICLPFGKTEKRSKVRATSLALGALVAELMRNVTKQVTREVIREVTKKVPREVECEVIREVTKKVPRVVEVTKYVKSAVYSYQHTAKSRLMGMAMGVGAGVGGGALASSGSGGALAAPLTLGGALLGGIIGLISPETGAEAVDTVYKPSDPASTSSIRQYMKETVKWVKKPVKETKTVYDTVTEEVKEIVKDVVYDDVAEKVKDIVEETVVSTVATATVKVAGGTLSGIFTEVAGEAAKLAWERTETSGGLFGPNQFKNEKKRSFLNQLKERVGPVEELFAYSFAANVTRMTIKAVIGATTAYFQVDLGRGEWLVSVASCYFSSYGGQAAKDFVHDFRTS